MLSTTCTTFLLAVAIISNPIADVHASKIDTLDVPLVIRNGTGPIDLICIYDVKADENGLVVKWYHDLDQIYQWIPPMPPQDLGVINGFAEYPRANLEHPNSRSVIRLKMVTVKMAGEYTCAVSTFQEEDSKKTTMIVYEPETSATIHVSSLNETHLNVTCVANGAEPRPALKLYAEGTEVSGYREKEHSNERDRSVKRTAFVRNTMEPKLLDCEISIPRTDYKRRERIVYYPAQSLSLRSNAIRSHQDTSLATYIVIVFSCALISLSK